LANDLIDAVSNIQLAATNSPENRGVKQENSTRLFAVAAILALRYAAPRFA